MNIYRVSCVMWAKIKNIGQIRQTYQIRRDILIYHFLIIIIINRLVKVVQEPEEFQLTYNVTIEILSWITTTWKRKFSRNLHRILKGTYYRQYHGVQAYIH